jgi:hypothetical protein
LVVRSERASGVDYCTGIACIGDIRELDAS